MRPLYLLAVFGTRLLGVISMLILSHLMLPAAFGEFSLVYTNALLIQMIFGSWLVSVATRVLVSANNSIDRDAMSVILSVGCLAVAAILGCALAFTGLHPEVAWTSIATAALAAALVIYDVTLAIKNALGREGAYATFALMRNVMALVLSISFVVLGFGSLGPVVGFLVGTIAPIVLLPSARAILASARPSLHSLLGFRRFLKLGSAGGLVLGTYILVNAPTRNIMAYRYGESYTGIWTLFSDLFYGPLAVVGNAYALSQIRLIYLASSVRDHEAMGKRTRDLMEFTLMLAMGYATTSILFAGTAAAILAPKGQSEVAALFAVPAAIQGAIILFVYSLTTVALAHGRFAMVGAMVVTTALAATVGTYVAPSIDQIGNFSMLGCLFAALVWSFWAIHSQLFSLRWREVGKLLIALCALCAFALSGLYLFRFSGGWIAAGLLGAVAFLVVAWAVNLRAFVEAIPAVVRKLASRLTGRLQF